MMVKITPIDVQYVMALLIIKQSIVVNVTDAVITLIIIVTGLITASEKLIIGFFLHF